MVPLWGALIFVSQGWWKVDVCTPRTWKAALALVLNLGGFGYCRGHSCGGIHGLIRGHYRGHCHGYCHGHCDGYCHGHCCGGLQILQPTLPRTTTAIAANMAVDIANINVDISASYRGRPRIAAAVSMERRGQLWALFVEPKPGCPDRLAVRRVFLSSLY